MSLRKILEDFGTDLKEDLQKAMIEKGITSDGQNSRLGHSIRFFFGENNGQPVFKLAANDYLQVVDEGRGKGKKMPPLTPILNWMKKKGIRPDMSKKTKNLVSTLKNKQLKKAVKTISKEKAAHGMAFAIAKSIGKHGTIKRFNYNGADFFDHVVKDGRVKKLQADIAAFLKKDITIELTKDGDNNN